MKRLKGLPDKNILEVDGHPLIAYSIAFALKLGVDRVIVSTDSEGYRSIARHYGTECYELRSATASSDAAREEDVIADVTQCLKTQKIADPAIWVWLKPVNPFRTLSSVRNALALLHQRPEVDSVRIISESDARLHRINEAGFLEPHGSGWDESVSKMPRTRFPRVFHPYNLEIFRHGGWVERGPKFMGTQILPIVEHRITGLDIDDIETFEIVKALIEARPRSDVVARHIYI